MISWSLLGSLNFGNTNPTSLCLDVFSHLLGSQNCYCFQKGSLNSDRGGSNLNQMVMVDFWGISLIPNAPCREYLPTFTINLWWMWVYIPYVEHLGITGHEVWVGNTTFPTVLSVSQIIPNQSQPLTREWCWENSRFTPRAGVGWIGHVEYGSYFDSSVWLAILQADRDAWKNMTKFRDGMGWQLLEGLIQVNWWYLMEAVTRFRSDSASHW